ncbi:hypothetical protein [Maricaulis sp.]|uniref:hypothetical protein n=1 Tax=Maricaulis sp. TaxID=1486257 RepID=UPI0032970F49
MESRLGRIAGIATLAAASLGLSAQTRPPAEPVRTASLAALQQQQQQPPAPDAPRTMPINWAAAREDARTQTQFNTQAVAVRQVQRFPQPVNDGAANVAATRLPVLIPTSAALGLGESAVTRLFPQADFYTLSITGPDILVEVFGTRLAHAVPPDAASRRRLRAADPAGYRVSQTEYGRELSFNRYGAAYSVTVECAAPGTDTRCTSETYVRQLADALMIAAGSPEPGEE